MKPTTSELRSQVVQVSNDLHRNGWVANHDGNVTVRLGDGRYLATPTAVSKGDVSDHMLIVVDRDRKVLQGTYRAFSEFVLHLAAYDTRPDVMAVIHAHPPNATAFAVAGRGLGRPILPEAVVSLGPRVPLVPFARPGSDGFVTGPAEALETYDAVLLENHGVVTVGATLEQAYLRMELVEHLARIERLAQQIGSVQYLPDDTIDPLLDARKRAGLGCEARGMVDPDRGGASAIAADTQDLVRSIIAEELRALLK